jgi:hypothetical protein
MADRGADRDTVRNVGQPRDAGRTSGGGSLGHDQPKDVADQTSIRNQAGRRTDTGRQKDDPAEPGDEPTLKTQI